MSFRALLFFGFLAFQPLMAQSGWSLVWHDEFDGTALDTTKWGYDTGSNNGWGNAESEYYTSRTDNVYVQGGMLVIKAIRENFGGAPYTSGRILTQGKFTQAYGRFEARIKIPYGQGIWPAFWMLGDNINQPGSGWPTCGEVDIMENIGKEPGTVHGTIHGPGYSGGNGIGAQYSLPGTQRFADDFHVFAIEWEPGEIRWYVDDNLYKTTKSTNIPAGTTWVYNHPFFLLLNVAVGGKWPQYPDSTTVFPQYMYVDYVRVYKRGVVNGASFQSPVAPGSWVTIQGTDLAATTRTWRTEDFNGVNLPTALDGVSVNFNGKPAYVYYISPTQINVQAPDTGPGPLTVEVLNDGRLKTSVTATATVFAPAFFLWAGQYAVATHHDWSLAVKPGVFPSLTTVAAKPGEEVTLWGTGFGPTNPPMAAGQTVGTDVLRPVTTVPVVTINGLQAHYIWGGLTPGSEGLYQITVQLPADLPDGDLPVAADNGQARTPDGVYLTIAK